MLEFKCPECRRTLEIEDDKAGRNILCQVCGSSVPVLKWKSLGSRNYFPAGLMTAGILWIVLGGITILDRLLMTVLIREPLPPHQVTQLWSAFVIGLCWGGYTAFAGARAIAGKLPEVAPYAKNSLALGVANWLAAVLDLSRADACNAFVNMIAGIGYVVAALLTWNSAEAYLAWLNDPASRRRRRPRVQDYVDDEDEDDDAPRRKRRRDRNGVPTGLIVGLAIGIPILLITVGVIVALAVVGSRTRQDLAQNNNNPGLQEPARDAVPPPQFNRPPQPPPQIVKKPPEFVKKPPQKPAELMRPGEWLVLFRSQDPMKWNTASPDENNFAISIMQAPRQVRFLRLTRMDTGEALIVPVTLFQLSRQPNDVPPGHFAWNGNAKQILGARHLGIVEGPRVPFGKTSAGLISVLNIGANDFIGSGFGHKIQFMEKQCWCWRGKVLGPTVFEIAVTTNELSEDEDSLLLRPQGKQ
jgi:DNA-directed RNA polymerase subunit RPC12/RpoP